MAGKEIPGQAVAYPGQESDFWYSLRRSVPALDAAIGHLVRLSGGFQAETEPAAQDYLAEITSQISVDGTRQGLSAFADSYLEQLLTCGTAVGELSAAVQDGRIVPLLSNVPLRAVALRRTMSGAEICAVGKDGAMLPLKHPEHVFLSVLSPIPGSLCGTSLLAGLDGPAGAFVQILDTVKRNWERLGSVRYHVSTHADTAGGAPAAARAGQLAERWRECMRTEGAPPQDFITTGNVEIKVIGAECRLPDCAVPIRTLLEQMVAKTGLPPFLLGLQWGTADRLGTAQLDLLTTGIESYRRILTPVLVRICRCLLQLAGFCSDVSILWEDVSLKDTVETAKAALLRAQTQALLQ
ncbi:MAG: serine/threonine protein phosphatase [Oscillospiraceae bacterium]|jgi:hypothetical protein|nr:serine/threonine protein phosphatase [Oscillospiraceae bacterium]